MPIALGIIGTLLGVVIGAFLTRWIDFSYARRQEMQRAVVSALVLREELRDTELGITVVIDSERGVKSFLYPGLKTWDDHRERLLLAGMSHDDWAELARCFRQLLEIVPMLKDEEVSEQRIEFFESVRERCEAAQELLEPFAVEGDVPLLRPGRVFKT